MRPRPCVPLLVGVLFAVSPSASQEYRKEPYTIPVATAAGPLEHPFIGGLYNPLHQFVDVNGDGDLDLFLFDTNDRSFTFFRNRGTPTAPVLRWERPDFVLPPVSSWFRFADLRADDLPDFLTAGDSLNTLSWYVNTGTPAMPIFVLSSREVRDSLNQPVYVQQECIPAFSDIDADGDLDLFSLNPSIGTINFYENAGTPQLPQFVFRTDFYQQIQICTGCGRHYPLHGLGTMSFSDIDADGDADMLYGDLYDTGLFFYRNDGTPGVAVLDSITGRFPPSAPVATAGFNQPTLADIDGDGDVDLFVSVLGPFQRIENFSYYQNRGSGSAYDFQLVARDFLASVDVGLQSVPCAADIDADGDPDLFVGGLYGNVAFLRNTGSSGDPAYLLVDTAYISNGTRFGYAPALADPDGDGDLDLFLGHFGGSIEFHRNDGTPASPVFHRVVSFFDSITVGLYAAPAFMDLDADGDLDLFVGKGDGRLAFYRNTGTSANWTYQFETNFFQGIDVGGNARPAFADVDGDGDRDLIVGGDTGSLTLFRNDGPPGAPLFVEITRSYAGIDPVHEAAPAFVDIDNDGDQDLMVGSLRGGLEFYRNMTVTSVNGPVGGGNPAEMILEQNYPNPFNAETSIGYRIQDSGVRCAVSLQVYDVLGRCVAMLVDGVKEPGSYSVRFDARGLSSGLYVYRLRAGSTVQARKTILLR